MKLLLKVGSLTCILLGVASVLSGCARSTDAILFDPDCRPLATFERTSEHEQLPSYVELWSIVNAQSCMRTIGPMRAAQQAEIAQELEVKPVFSSHLSYHQRVIDAYTAGQGPTIAFLDAPHVLLAWIEQERIVPVTPCLAGELDWSMIDGDLWSLYAAIDPASNREEIWAIPLDLNLHPLFIHRGMLRELGWSEAEIDSLPEEIALGDFILADLLRLAQEAQAQAIVKPGYAFWMAQRQSVTVMSVYRAHGGRVFDSETQQVVFDRDAWEATYRFFSHVAATGLTHSIWMDHPSWSGQLAWRDAIAHGRVLFWQGEIFNWNNWATEFVAEEGGRAYLAEHVLVTPFPSAVRGRPASTYVRAGGYVVAAPASTHPYDLQGVCALLHETLTPAINLEHAWRSSLASVMRQDLRRAAAQRDRFDDQIEVVRRSYWSDARVPLDKRYPGDEIDYAFDTFYGRLTPEAAVQKLLDRLTIVTGNELLVE